MPIFGCRCQISNNCICKPICDLITVFASVHFCQFATTVFLIMALTVLQKNVVNVEVLKKIHSLHVTRNILVQPRHGNETRICFAQSCCEYRQSKWVNKFGIAPVEFELPIA